MGTECKTTHKVFIQLFQHRFFKSYFNTKGNTAQNVLAKKHRAFCLEVILVTYSRTSLAQADSLGAMTEC